MKNLDWANWAAVGPNGAAALQLWGVAFVLSGFAVGGCQRNDSVRGSVAQPVDATSNSEVVVPVEPIGPLAITWEQLDVGMEPDSVFQPWMMTTQIKVLEGRQVRLTGYMCGAIFQHDNIRDFPLMRELECPFGPGGQAHHVVEVELQGKLRTRFTTEPVTIEGTFGVHPRTGPNGKTWSLYRIDGTRIE